MWTDVQRLVVGLTEPSEFGCKFGRYLYRSRCNCSCLTFCTNYKYETHWIVISSEEAMGQVSLFTFSRALKTFTRYEVVTRFSL